MEDSRAPAAGHDGGYAHVFAAGLQHHSGCCRGHVVVGFSGAGGFDTCSDAEVGDGRCPPQVVDFERRLDGLDVGDQVGAVDEVGVGQGGAEAVEAVGRNPGEPPLQCNPRPGESALFQQRS